MAGLAIAVLTDLLAAMILTNISVKMAVEVLIIAVFVVVGSRFAAWVTATCF